MLSPIAVIEAYKNIQKYINNSSNFESKYLNNALGHRIIFKSDHLQKTGAFKIRGALNSIISNTDDNIKKIIAYSSGNHGIAVAHCAKQFGLKAEIYMPENSSDFKKDYIKSLGGELIITQSRLESENKAIQKGKETGNIFLHPSDSDSLISGAGTLAFEALNSCDCKPDAIFATIGGGALISGTYLASKLFDNNINVIGCEPKIACDAFDSKKNNKILSLKEYPDTIADGARTLKISLRTFEYIKLIDQIILINENDIMYWTLWLNKLFGEIFEPTASLAMAGAYNWLKEQESNKTIIVILSGGNIDANLIQILEKKSFLQKEPYITRNKRIIA